MVRPSPGFPEVGRDADLFEMNARRDDAVPGRSRVPVPRRSRRRHTTMQDRKDNSARGQDRLRRGAPGSGRPSWSGGGAVADPLTLARPYQRC